MRYSILSFTVFLCLFSQAFTQTKINISGTIVNQANSPVNGMIVKLAGQTLFDTSTNQGAFEITGDITSLFETLPQQKLELYSHGNNFTIDVPDGSQRLTMEIFNMKGERVATVFKDKVLPEGSNTLPVLSTLSALASSVLIAVVRRGSDMYRFRIVKAGNDKFAVQQINHTSGSLQPDPTSSAALALDSLRFLRRGKVEFCFPITKWVDKFKVTLDLIPYEVTDVGLNEWNLNHIWPDQVGTTITEYPGKLTNYLNKTGSGPHDYEAWCSEFYSWCNRLGGYPFGNDQGSTMDPNWMVDAHTKLKAWFEAKNAYIPVAQITSSGYKPVPGDFVHLSEYEGHTAMVNYVSNDTVYTIEGNYVPANQMKVWSRGYYKTVETLLGYGRRSGVYGSSYTSISNR